MTPQEYRNRLFGESAFQKINALKNFQKQIDSFFSDHLNNSLTDKKSIYAKFLLLENSLPDTFDPDNRVLTFNKIISEDSTIEPTPFLSDDAIGHILEIHPPNSINTLVRKLDLHDNLEKRTILALTRFTENQDWQHKYQELLRSTSNTDYAPLKPRCVGVDTEVFEKNIIKNGHELKPWVVSHSKETGIILIFENLNNHQKTPNLLSLAVFLHYLYEVYHFSRFLSLHSETNTGELAKTIIREKEPLFPFLTDGNAHDETLYWKKAINHLTQIIPEGDWDLFNKSLESFVIDDTEISSAHFVDILWDINSVHPNTQNFYHLQQEVWLSLEKHLSEMAGVNFQTLIENSLMLNNVTFLEQILQNNKRCLN